MAPPHSHICSPMWSDAAANMHHFWIPDTCCAVGSGPSRMPCLHSECHPPHPLPTVSRKPSLITQGFRTDGFSTLTLIHSLLLTSLSEHIFNPFHRHVTGCVLLVGSIQAFLAQWSREESRPISGWETTAGFIRMQGYAEKHLLLPESVPSSGDSALCLAALKVQEDSLEMCSPHLS